MKLESTKVQGKLRISKETLTSFKTGVKAGISIVEPSANHHCPSLAPCPPKPQ